MMAKGPFSSVLQSSLSGIEFGKQANWFVSHVDSCSGLFYLQQNEPSISVKYERQMQDIETAVSQGRLESFIKTPPAVGSLCIAQYSEDSQWYRGQVLGFVEDDSEIVEVVFIDYGNGENLSWKCLKKAPREFSELPAQAIQCKLAKIQPVGGIWVKEGIKLLKELILERELVGKATHLCKSGAVLVVLYADEEKSALVAEQLVMAGFAYWKKMKSSLSQSSSSSSSTASIAASVNAKPGQLGQLKIKVGSHFDLFISHINSLDNFYCQPVENSKSLDESAKEMQVFYNSDKANELKLTTIRLNQVCCARYSADAAWYRAIVKKVSVGQNYEVQFVDFGNSELLPSSEIRDLTSTFRQLPISSVNCVLHGTRPRGEKSSFDNDAIQKFEDLTFEKQLVGYVSQVDEAGKLAIILYDKTDSNGEININKELAKLSSVVFDEGVKLSPIKSDSSHGVKGAAIPHLVSMQLNEGDCEVGYVAFAQSPFDFSCQLSKSAASLENMMQELNDEYLALKPGENKLQLIETGVPCCARYSGDGRFYRAELKKIVGTNAMIHFVDYGNDEQCRMDEVKYLRKEYLKLPKQAFKCKLAGIEKPPGNALPTDVCAQFNDMVMDKEFNIRFVSIDSQSICEVSLVENNDRNVVTFDAAKVLIDSGMVQPLRMLNKDDLGPVTTTEQFRDVEIPKGEFMDIMPTHIANPNEFCCQLLENSDQIDTLMADLESTYKDSSPSKSLKLKSGMPCVALYPVDENWYRGLVVHVRGREADVNYVDFGNTETLTVDGIRLIHSKFMKLPAQAVVCTLSDIIPKGEGDWSEGAISLFSELTLEKQLIACFKMKDESNLHHIELLDTQTDRKQQMDIADILIGRGLAEQKKLSSNSQTNEHQESSSTEKRAFSKVNLRAKAEETVYISHIDDLENLYCHLTSQEDSLYELLEKVSRESEKLPPVTSLVKGQLVCALFSVDNAWYRGEVTKVIDSGNAIVKFVDYGNSETTMMSSMREISSGLLEEPEYAIHCSLYGGGMKWKNAALKELIKVTTDKVLKMTVKEVKDEKYIIDLLDENSVAIGSTLVDSTPPLPQNICRQSTGKEQSARKEQMNVEHPVVESIEVKPGTKMDCFISYVESLTEFYVQQCNTSKDLDFVSEELVKAPSFAGLVHPKKGDICCANYESDNLWYRAEIIQVNGNEAETFFFDYGNSDVVNIRSLKSLPKNLHATPRLSIACALDGVTSQSDDHIDTFCNMTVDKTVSIEFIRKNADGHYDVEVRVSGELIVFQKGKKDPRLIVDVKETASSRESNAAAAAAAQSYSTAQSPAVIVEFNEKSLQVGDKEKVFVCYVVTAQEFYCQLSREISVLNSMMDKLEEYYGNEPPGRGSLVSLVAGVPCAAKYSVDGCWYRAALECLQDPSHAKVNFVDYGNSETVEVEDLKILKEEFLEHPTFAVKCSLLGYGESASEFENEVMDREVELKVTGLSGSAYIVDLVCDDGRGLGSSATVAVGSVEKAAHHPLKSFKKAEIVKEGSTINVYYLDGISPQDFYCHIAEYEVEFETLTKEIAQKGTESGSLDAMEAGTPCLALFSEDGCWYRGKVLEAGEGKSKVAFVDYGNEEWVEHVHIKSIPDDLLKLPVQAVRFCLANSRPASSTWTAAERELFQSKCDAKLLSATIKSCSSEKFNVILIDTQTGENINEAFSSFLNGNSEGVDRIDDKPRFKNADVSKGMMLEALCTFVKEDGKLSCQLIKYEKELSKLMKDIPLYCSQDAEKVSNIEVDLACFALYDLDDSWYRAKVLKSDGNSITVRFVDYGNEAVCSLENLRKVRPKDLELPATCIDCSIAGIVVDEGVVDAIELNCLEEELIVNIKDVLNAELVLAEVLTMENKQSVSDVVNKISSSDAMICETQKSDAESGLRYEKVTLEVGASKDVICTNVTSFNVVSCQILGYEDRFDEMMEQIAVYCEGNKDVLKSAVKGQSCLGKYSVDEGWYRAEILDAPSDRVRLRYVDYGNEDDVPFADTREMSEEFMQLPALSILCELHDVDRGNLDVIKAKEWLEGSCVNDVYKAFVVAANDDGSYDVTLHFLDSNKSINESLLANFAHQEYAVEAPTANGVATYAAPDEKPDAVDKSSSLDEAAPSQSGIEELQYTRLQLKSSDRLRAICSYIDDDVKIYCQPTEYSLDLEQLMTDIAEYCVEKSRTIVTLNVGVPCFAFYSEDGTWYRAEVVRVDGELFEVLYVDYGNCSVVKRDEVLPMTRPFLKLAKSCFACILQGSLDSLPLADAKVWLEENLIEKELEIEIISNHDGDCYLATLYLEGKDVESLLKGEFQDIKALREEPFFVEDDGFASKKVEKNEINKFTREDVSCPSNENAFCTHVESLHEVFVQRAKYQEQFDDLFETIQAYCNEKGSMPKDFGKGSCCLAKYSQDEQWYRAEIMENTKESVKVRFVDYGNTDIVLFENTRALSEEFTSLPAASMRCHLHDVHEKDIDVPEAVRWLKENVVEQEVSVEIVGAFEDCYDCILRRSGDDETVNDQLYYQFELTAEDHCETADISNTTEEATTEEVESTRTEREATAIEIKAKGNESEAQVDHEKTQDIESQPQAGECEAQSDECKASHSQTNKNEEQGSTVESIEKEAVDTGNVVNGNVDNGNVDNGNVSNGNVNVFYVGKISQQAPQLGAKECVVCTHVESLNCISIQLLEFQEKFHDISRKISEFCQESKTLPEKFDAGIGCLARSEDEEWYRAEFISVSNENVDVRFVDYGNTETVLKQNTRAITKEFASLPAMSVSCQLHDVHDSDIDVKKAEDWLHENLVEHDIDVEIIGRIDDTYDVIITRRNENVSVNDLLYKEFELQEESLPLLEDNGVTSEHGLNTADAANAKLNPNATEFSPLTESSSITNPLEIQSNLLEIQSTPLEIQANPLEMQSNPLEIQSNALEIQSNTREIQSNPRGIQSRRIDFCSTVKMHLSFQVSPSLFWCQFDDSGDELLKMMEEMEISYDGDSVPPFSASPEVGTICCAQFSEDRKWYRGEVCETYDNSNCMIHFIDYGNSERVELSDMKELKPQFFNLAKQAIKCSLDGVRPVDGEWSEESTFEFEELCADKILDVDILSEGETLNVIVRTGDCDVTVNQVMIEKGFGKVDGAAAEAH